MSNLKEFINDIIEIIIAIMMVIALIILGYFIFFFDYSPKYNNEKIETETEYKIMLRSIQYNSETQGKGSFVLGQSYGIGNSEIKTQNYYVCYQILEDGGLKLFKMDVEKTTIYETDDDTAYAIQDISTEEIKLYVPRNTIKQEYNL